MSHLFILQLGVKLYSDLRHPFFPEKRQHYAVLVCPPGTSYLVKPVPFPRNAMQFSLAGSLQKLEGLGEQSVGKATPSEFLCLWLLLAAPQPERWGGLPNPELGFCLGNPEGTFFLSKACILKIT